ncbi:hypothetical protein ACFQYP_01775 [Nonomuraea antimicrobica]
MNVSPSRIFRPGEHAYDAERMGLNRAVESRPAFVVGAAGSRDVVAAVRMAAAQGRAVGVLAGGHSPSVAADGAVQGFSGAVSASPRTTYGGCGWSPPTAVCARSPRQ